MSKFCISSPKGFHITFDNGYTLSVQFGPGNYCDNYDRKIMDDDVESGKDGSTTAETAFWGPDGKMLSESEDGDSVQGYQTVEQVIQRLIRVHALPKQEVK